jgi:hypothetical protein
MTAPKPACRVEAVPTLSRDGKPWRVYLENTTQRLASGGTRSAYYEATGTGRGDVRVRYGRIGSAGTVKVYSYSRALVKLHEKHGGHYCHTGGCADPGTVPVQAMPRSRRVQALRDRLGATTMRPTTQQQLLERAGAVGLSPMHVDADYRDVFKGCDAVSVLQARDGTIMVVVRYGSELVWGAVKTT